MFLMVHQLMSVRTGDRGVFEAYDYGHPEGCAAGTAVIVKAWLDPEDGECVMESRVYASLTSHAVDGVPALRQCRYDAKCEVYALVLEKLGPSLQDLLNLLPTRKFSTKMVLALAIQMVWFLFCDSKRQTSSYSESICLFADKQIRGTA
jgi:hypothetical protein